MTRPEEWQERMLDEAACQLAISLAGNSNPNSHLLQERMDRAEASGGTRPENLLNPFEREFLPASRFIVERILCAAAETSAKDATEIPISLPRPGGR